MPPKVPAGTQTGLSKWWLCLETLSLPSFVVAQYEKELARFESKGGKTARKLAHFLRVSVEGETRARIRQNNLLYLALKIKEEDTRRGEDVDEYNSLIQQVLRKLRSISEKQALSEALKTLGLNVCEYCLKIKSPLDASHPYCSPKCHKHALDRRNYLSRKAR